MRYKGHMPRLYPADPVFGDGAQAERAVWEVLRDQLPDDAVLFYAVRLIESDRFQEIDLLVAWPRVGIAAIEVTGGVVNRDESGWSEEVGGRRSPIDPVGDIRTEEHMLHRLLVDESSPAAAARFVHLVALPHTPVDRDWSSPDLPRALVLDRDDLGGDVARLVRTAVREFGHEQDGPFAHGGEPLSEAGLEDLVDRFGGQMPSQMDILRSPGIEEERLRHITRDQAKVLDVFEYYPRLVVTGAAGSGKTWLALELARRRARAGDRVAILCRSRGLARYLQRVVAVWDVRERPTFVGVPQDLLRFWGREPLQVPGAPMTAAEAADYWTRRLPVTLFDLAVRRPDVECFDALIVDEAQEFGDEWWPAIAECLREPQIGSLVVFTDNGTSDEWRRSGAPVDVAPLELAENVRSSRQIARLTDGFALSEVLPRGRKRAAVRFVDVPAEEAVTAAEDAVDALVDEGYEPGDIAVLSTATPWSAEEDLVAFEGYPAYWDNVLAGTDVHRGSVLGFEGLERAVVVLVVSGFSDPDRAREILYTGLSRARSLLVVVGPADVIEEAGGERVRKRLRKARAWDPLA